MRKECPICGAGFDAPPSGRKTCSMACERLLKSRSQLGHRVGDDARARISAAARMDGRMTAELQAAATRANAESEGGRRGPLHRSAKAWVVESPEGDRHELVNLLDWARENAELFGDVPGDAAGRRIANGFAAVKRSLNGTLSEGQRGVATYKGWKLVDWEE